MLWSCGQVLVVWFGQCLFCLLVLFVFRFTFNVVFQFLNNHIQTCHLLVSKLLVKLWFQTMLFARSVISSYWLQVHFLSSPLPFFVLSGYVSGSSILVCIGIRCHCCLPLWFMSNSSSAFNSIALCNKLPLWLCFYSLALASNLCCRPVVY